VKSGAKGFEKLVPWKDKVMVSVTFRGESDELTERFYVMFV
jgi:hypothetical protein